MGSGAYTPVVAPTKYLDLAFFVGTDSNGDPTNAATAKDQYGEPLTLPKEVAAIARTEIGVYTVTLKQDWYKLAYANAEPYYPKEAAQATCIGTVDLTGLTLSTLNTLTLITDDDVDSARTTTFTTPTSVADIAAQIAARMSAVGNTTTKAEILTLKTGAKYLKVNSTTIGSTSDMLITGTARATLGMGDGSTHFAGARVGKMSLLGFNSKGAQVDLTSKAVRAVRNIIFVHQSADNTNAAVASGGFFVNLKLQVHQ